MFLSFFCLIFFSENFSFFFLGNFFLRFFVFCDRCLPSVSLGRGFEPRPSLICGPLECGLLSVTKKFRRKIKVVLNYWRTFKFHLEFFFKRKKQILKSFNYSRIFFVSFRRWGFWVSPSWSLGLHVQNVHKMMFFGKSVFSNSNP